VAIIGGYFTIRSATSGAWLLGLLALVVTVALIIVNSGGPRRHRFGVSREKVVGRIDGWRRSRIEYPLDQFDSFTFIEPKPTKREPRPQPMLVLFFAFPGRPPLALFLTKDEPTNQAIVDELATLLPYTDARNYKVSQGLLDRMARWLGIG